MTALTLSGFREIAPKANVRFVRFRATPAGTSDTIDLSSYFTTIYGAQAIVASTNAATTCTYSGTTITTTGTSAASEFLVWGIHSSA